MIEDLVTEEGVPVLVFSLNPDYGVNDNFLLRYLRDERGLEIQSPYSAYQPTLIHKLYAALLTLHQSRRDPERGLAYRTVATVGSAIAKRLLPFNLLKEQLYDRSWAAGFLKLIGVELLVFDWVKRSQYVVGSLLDAVEVLEIPTLALPHGANLISSGFRSTLDARNQRIENYGKHWDFDAVVVQNPVFAEYVVTGGVPEDRLHILGSARYCPEWMNKLLPLAVHAEPSLPKASNKLRVLLIDKPFGTLPDELKKTVDFLAKADFVQFAIKPPSRNNMGTIDYSGVDAIFVPGSSTPALVEWADVVVGTVSSALVEPVLRGKPLLYPKYMNPTPTLFEDLEAAWVVHDMDELRTALKIIHASPEQVPDLSRGADALAQEIVYGGLEGRDVLSRYRSLILRMIGRLQMDEKEHQ